MTTRDSEDLAVRALKAVVQVEALIHELDVHVTQLRQLIESEREETQHDD